MACYYPIPAFKSRNKNESGKHRLLFTPARGFVQTLLPCQRCIGCRLERSRNWAARILHEAQLHADNMFITLTYNDEHLPPGGTLIKKDFQDFMKRLRKGRAPLRYFHCGEYGDDNKRPHYHAILFGVAFADQKIHRRNDQGDRIYTSETLAKLWGKGFVEIGDVTFSSAAYVARYCVKKINGPQSLSHYRVVDLGTGEITDREPEYGTMSLKPGIGAGWFDKFKTDAYPSDFIIVQGKKMKPPKYYDQLLEREDPALLEVMKETRRAYGDRQSHNNTTARLRVRETVKRAAISTLKRKL